MPLSKANNGVKSASFRNRLGMGGVSASKAWRSGQNMSDESFSGLSVEKKTCFGLIGTEGQFDFGQLKKNVINLRYNTKLGNYWDVLQVLLSLLACGIYVSESYYYSYRAIHMYWYIESIITQFFLVDFIISWYISSSTATFYRSPMTWVDLVTIIPVYLSNVSSTPNLSLLRFVRILRLVRILRTFRLLGGFSGVRRQIITLSLTLLSMIFLAAGIIHLAENTFNKLKYDCQYISVHTNYEPSCHKSYSSYDDPTCDCRTRHCYALHSIQDRQYEPTQVGCPTIEFFESLYFIVVTTSVVGYGDYEPTTQPSRIATLVFIISALIVIPMQINKLQTLLAMNSPFRTSYEPRPHENHVILCGFVNDKTKLSRIFREFFHPDRSSTNSPEFHLLILNPNEPTDEVKELLHSPLFDSRVSYIIGSALDMEDLQKARADVASGIFFLCSVEVDEEDAVLDDAATVLRTLSVSNFNPDLECLVQVLRSQDRELLKDTDVEVVLCFDEFKTSLQCRNAICPGLATFTDNLFNSFGDSTCRYTEKVGEHWLAEYTYGARMELYYVPIDMGFFAMLGYSWPLLVECVYLEFECTFIGVCNVSEHAAFLNPRQAERKKFRSLRAYFDKYNVGILLAPNYSVASAIGYAMTDPVLLDRMISNMIASEEQFAVRRHRAMATEDTGGFPMETNMSTVALKLAGFGKSVAALVKVRKAQNLIDGDFVELERRRASLAAEHNQPSQAPVDAGAETDSSQENDDDFLGYIEKPDINLASTDSHSRRRGVAGGLSPLDMLSSDSGKGGSLRVSPVQDQDVEPVVLKVDTSSTFVRSSSMGLTQIIRKQSSITDVEVVAEEGSSSENDDKVPTKFVKSTAVLDRPRDVSSNDLGLLDDNDSAANFKNMRMFANTRTSKTRGVKPTASLKNVLGKRNKMKNLREITAMLQENAAKDSENASGEAPPRPNIPGGSKGKFAMLARRAVHTQPLGSRPVSIMTALQLTRRQSIEKKGSAAAMHSANMKESLEKITGRAPSEGAVNAVLMFTQKSRPGASAAPTLSAQVEDDKEKDMPDDGQAQQSVDRLSPSGPASTTGTAAPKSSPDDASTPTIANMMKKFRKQDEERRSFRRVLSTRISSFEDKADTDSRAPNRETNDSTTAADPKNAPNSTRSVFERKDSGGANPKILRQDSSCGELISVTAPSSDGRLDRSAALRYASQLQVGSGRRKMTVDTAMRRFEGTGFEQMRQPQMFGQDSEEIEDAADLRNHVIVFGSMDHIHMFVAELRKPLVVGDAYHQILIVSPHVPRKWYQIQNRHKDVYFLECNVSSSYEMTLMNVREAFALVLLAARETISLEESSNIDSEALFMYLKMERFVPRDVFFTVELVCPNNMGVLNSAIVRRTRIEKDANNGASDWGVGTATGMASCLKGSHNFRGSVDLPSMLFHMKAEREYEKKEAMVLETSGKFSRLANTKVSPAPIIGADDRRMSMSALRKFSSGSDTSPPSQKKEIQKMSAGNYWDVYDTHHVLPVYAASRAVTSTSFDSILCQSFFGALTPQLCEKLVGGQETQTMLHTRVPSAFFGRKYMDLFRALNSRRILPLALYRTPLPKNDAILPYVYTNPSMESVVNGDDRLLLYGDPSTIHTILKKFELPLVRKNGNMSLGEEMLPLSTGKPADKVKITFKNTTGHKSSVATAYQPIQARPRQPTHQPFQARQPHQNERVPEEKEDGTTEKLGQIELTSKPTVIPKTDTGKGWGALLGARVHPVQKYMERKISRTKSRSPPAAQRSRDTEDIKEVAEVTRFGSVDDDQDKSA